MSIPLISLADASSPAALAQAISAACRTHGFLYLTEHGIAQTDIDGAFASSRAFFEDESADEKERVRAKGTNVGWTTLRQETLNPVAGKATKGDLHESFYLERFGPDGTASQALPPTLAAREAALASFFQQCHALSLRLLGYFALSLNLSADFFTPLHPATLDRLRLLHYPPFEPSADEKDVRTGAHSDYGSLTLLFQKDVGGLEVLVPRRQDALSTDVAGGEWVAAPIVNGAIVVNIGDAMEAWTTGLFRSTLHRVPLPTESSPRRYSIAYFCQPADQVSLSGLPATSTGQLSPDQWREVLRRKNLLGPGGEIEVLTAGEHLRRRLASTYSS